MLDMPAKTEQERPAAFIKAWRVAFRKDANDIASKINQPHRLITYLWSPNAEKDADDIASDLVVEVKQPRHLIAYLCPTNAADVLAEATPQSEDSFTILWVPRDTNSSDSTERYLEDWARGGNTAVVRAGVRTVRIFWNFSRALIYASAQNIDAALNAVIRFTVAQRATIALVADMGATWAAIEADTPLTHSVTARQQRKQSHVNEMTERATRMNAALLRITEALEQLDSSLEESSKRIYAELVLAGTLYDRLELLEDQVEFALEHYEIANTRLIEAKFAYREQRDAMIGHASQAAIILLLLYSLHQHLFW
jgi:hypothetical protein